MAPEQATSAVAQAISKPVADPFLQQFEVVRNVTLPVIPVPKAVTDPAMYVKITSKMELAQDLPEEQSIQKRRRILKDSAGNPIKDANGNVQYAEPEKRKMDPPITCEAINLRTGEEGIIVVNNTISSNLDTKYPSDAYIGKCFEIAYNDTKKSGAGFNYKTFNIKEIKLKSDTTAPAKPAVAAKR